MSVPYLFPVFLRLRIRQPTEVMFFFISCGSRRIGARGEKSPIAEGFGMHNGLLSAEIRFWGRLG